MAPKKSDPERFAAIERRHNELLSYFELFEAAFDEFHDAVVKQVNAPGQNVRSYDDYPIMSLSDSGFPSFREAGFYQDGTPKQYVSTIQARGLAGLFGGYTRPKAGFPKCAELAAFLRSHDIGKRWDFERSIIEDTVSDYPIERLRVSGTMCKEVSVS